MYVLCLLYFADYIVQSKHHKVYKLVTDKLKSCKQMKHFKWPNDAHV